MTPNSKPPGISDRDRLAAFNGYAVLDTMPGPGFDGIVEVATRGRRQRVRPG